MPDVMLAVVNPKILQVLGLLTGILKAAKKKDVVLAKCLAVSSSTKISENPNFKVSHTSSTPSRRCFSL